MSWFVERMNKQDGTGRSAAMLRRVIRSAKSPVAMRLRLTMKKAGSWAIPLEAIARATMDVKSLSKPVALNVVKSITQSGLRRAGTMWGR